MFMRAIKAFARFWYQLVIGDDWRIAAIVVAVLGSFGALAKADLIHGEILAVAAAVFLVAAFTALLFYEARKA